MEQNNAVAISVRIDGNPDSWQVYKKSSDRPLFGKKEIHENSLLFRPVIAFQSGNSYSIKKNGSIKYNFTVPEIVQPTPEVVQIYPASERLPANLLKFYIRFSQSMAEGNPYPGLHLVNSEGDTLKGIFLEQLPALWNKERTILSLWLDPGRIKRDLNLNRKFGNPLQENKYYSLLVDTTLKSRDGIPLQSAAQKRFSAAAADRQKPDTESWKIDVPQKESTGPLIIHFKEAMDYLATYGRLEVWAGEKPVMGTSIFRSNERKWQFTPAHAWQKGSYTLRADARIEDLAGNNLNRLFDRDIKKKPQAEKDFYTITFKIR